MALLPKVGAIVILDSEGGRIMSKYYTKELAKRQQAFEKTLFSKLKKPSAKVDLVTVEDFVVLYRSGVDCNVCLITKNENEIIMMDVLDCFCDSILAMIKTLEKDFLMGNMDLLFLILDEMIDSGVLLLADAHKVEEAILSQSAGQDYISSAMATAKRLMKQ